MINRRHERCMIMGNGPSLICTLEQNEECLSSYDLIAVNDMAISSEYTKYKPSTYILCDPVYWFENITEKEKNTIINFYKQLTDKTDWPLQLYIPYEAKRSTIINELLSQNVNIRLNYYNKIKFEGYKPINYFVYKRQWGMPRAQNILIAALMLAIYSQYKEIYLAGVENDWMRNLWVDEQNRLRLDDYHYYNNEHGEKRILPLKIHEQCAALYFAFKSYTDIEDYSKYRGAKIYNITPLSFIDAFEKINKLT
jgi:hypothetical protein